MTRSSTHSRPADDDAVGARYREIVDHAVIGFFQTGFNNRFVAANLAMARMLGYAAPDDLLHGAVRIIDLYVHPEQQIEFAALMRRDSHVQNFEFQVRRPDGEVIWLSVNARALLAEDGSITGTEGTAADITAHKHAESAREQLRSEALSHAREVETLLDITAALNAARSEEAMVHAVAERVATLCDAGRASVGLFFGDHLLFSRRRPDGAWEECRYDVTGATSIVTHVLATRRSYLANDLPADPLSDHAQDAAMAVRAQLAVPIIGTDDQALGVLDLYDKRGFQPFSARDAALVEAVAAQLGVALERARASAALGHTLAALRQSEERFRSLVQHGSDMILVLNADGTLQDVSASTERVMGYAPEALRGGNPFGFVHPEDLPRLQASFAGVLAKPGSYKPTTFRARHADGSWHWLEATATNLLHDPSVRGIVENVRDITDRQRAEERLHLLAQTSAALAASLDYESTLTQAAQLAVPLLADWCVVHVVNDDGTIRRIAGGPISPDVTALVQELEARYPLELADPAGAPVVLRTGCSVFTPDVSDDDLRAIARDDRHLALLRSLGLRSHMYVPLIARGRALGVLSFMTSESGRRFSQEDLELAEELARRAAVAIDNARLFAAEQQARSAAERAADRIARLHTVTTALSEALTPAAVAALAVEHGMAALDAQAGAVALCTEDQTALTITSSIGFPAEWVAHRQRMPLEADLPVSQAVRTGVPVMFASRAERMASYPALGQAPSAPSEASAILPLAVEGRVHGALLLGFDQVRTFTAEEQSFMNALAQVCAQALERTRLQEQAAAAAAASEADRLKTELLNTVSHELRTPLAAIKGFTTTLLMFGGDVSPAEQTEFLTEIEGAAIRLQELVDDLLQVARLESGSLALEPAPLRLDAVLDQALERARARHPDRDITLTRARRLPPVLGDARRLEQVLANLVDNAVKYSPEGGPVAIRAVAGERAVRLSVTDQGIGITREHQGRIFEQFYRVDSQQTQGIGGTGLGLAICKRIVEAHGGRISVTSAPGKGSTFTVELPLPASARAVRAAPLLPE